MGDSLVICGAGPIGLVTLLAANAAGAAPIAITDIDENRLKMAKSLVPRVRTVRVQPQKDAKAVAADVKEALGRETVLAIECTGVESSIHTAIYVGARLRLVSYLKLTFFRSPPSLVARSTSSAYRAKTSRSGHSCTPRLERSIFASNSDTEKRTQRPLHWSRKA